MSSQGRTRFGACALVTILADGRWPRLRGAGWSSSSTVAWRPSVCLAASVILLQGLLDGGLLHGLLQGLLHSLLDSLLHGLRERLMQRLRTTRVSFPRRRSFSSRQGAQVGRAMTIEQDNQTVRSTRKHPGRTKSAQPSSFPQSQPICCFLFRHDDCTQAL